MQKHTSPEILVCRRQFYLLRAVYHSWMDVELIVVCVKMNQDAEQYCDVGDVCYVENEEKWTQD